MKLLQVMIVGLVMVLTAIPVWAESTFVKPTPDEALNMLQQGNRRFFTGQSLHPRQDQARLALAQREDQANYAFATVLACSDSRVPVELIFDVGVMDIFTVKVAGNVVDIDEAGSIEYGLVHVETPVLVVLGHTQCGAVTAVTHELQGHGHPLERNIVPLVDNIIPAVRRAMTMHPELSGDQVIPAGIEENVWQGIRDLFMISPSVREIAAKGRALVMGAIYDVGSGEVRWLPRDKVMQILSEVEQDPARALDQAGKGDTK
jgi:carbonic anhydrase